MKKKNNGKEKNVKKFLISLKKKKQKTLKSTY